jgi:drug/metabolite transporter (DMT)-like permease
MDTRGWLLSLACAVSFTIATSLYQAGFGHTTVTSAGFLVNTATIMTPLVALLLLRRGPALQVWPAAAAALAGALLMSGGAPGGFLLGDLLCLGAALSYAVWMVALGEFVSRYGRAGFMTILQFMFAAMVCCAAGLAFEGVTASGVVAALPQLLFIGALSTGGAYLLQAVAQRAASASEAAVIVSAEAVFGAAAAYVLLGETMSELQALGAAVIGLAIVMVQLPESWLPRRRVQARTRRQEFLRREPETVILPPVR